MLPRPRTAIANIAVSVIVVSMLLSTIPSELGAKYDRRYTTNNDTFTVSTSDPIRNETISEIPAEVETYDLGLWTEWYHHVDDWPIDDQEAITYYFYIDNSLLGSELHAFLDIYDAWFFADPDLDLYIYNPAGDLVAYSENPYDESEEVFYIADVTGYWSVVVHSYDGSGWFDLYRAVISNAAPILDYVELNTESPHINEVFAVDACPSYDIEDEGNITFSWYWDGYEEFQDYDNDGAADCRLYMIAHDAGDHVLSLTVADSFGQSSTIDFNIRALDPGWFSGDGDETQTLDLGVEGMFQFNQMTSVWQVPDVLPGEPFRFQFGLLYEIQLESTGTATTTLFLDAPPDDRVVHHIIAESSLVDVNYSVSFKPSLLINVWIDNETLSFQLPLISTEPAYEGEPSFSLLGMPIVYYWDDFVEIDLDPWDDGAGTLSFVGVEIFALAEIDLYPVVEWMVDNLAASMGAGWVDTATDFLEYFIDIEIPLGFNVMVTASGFQIVRLNSRCGGCLIMADLVTIHGPNSYYDPEDIYVFAGVSNPDYTVSSVLTVDTHVGVTIQPFVTLGFEVNGASLWEATVYEFSLQEAEEAVSWNSGDSSDFTWEYDGDLDGYPDNIDRFPSDSQEWIDSDDDGVGDNSDVFPDDPAETEDSDGDGMGDNADAFPQDPEETEDSDGDGIGDNADAFPSDPAESADSDGDGTGDNSDLFPDDPDETADTDSDGVGDNADAFPSDPGKWTEPAPSEGGLPGFGFILSISAILIVAVIHSSRRLDEYED